MDKISQASRWHISRARQIRKSHPELIAQYQHKRSKTYFFLISFLCSLQVVIASFCQYVPLYVVFLLSATVGAYIAWGLHHLMHELTHKTVYLSGYDLVRTLLYKVCTVTYPDLSLFVYYRWQHMPHHSRLGGNGKAEAYLGDLTDADVLAVAHLYAVKETKDAPPTVKHPGLFRRGAKKLLVGLFALQEYVINTLGFLRHIFLIPHTIYKPSAYTHRDREGLLRARLSLLIHLCVLVVFFSILVALAGWYAFVYLLLSFLFIKGLLFHPYILFWLTEHKTTQHEDFCQPTTSVYHWVTDVLFWHLNYHVEHHDFPAIAGKYLPLIREACHEQYAPLFHFKSLPDAYQQFFQADEAWTYGCQQVTPAAATASQETQHTG